MKVQSAEGIKYCCEGITVDSECLLVSLGHMTPHKTACSGGKNKQC